MFEYAKRYWPPTASSSDTKCLYYRHMLRKANKIREIFEEWSAFIEHYNERFNPETLGTVFLSRTADSSYVKNIFPP
jgi:hypothetical protein